MSYTAKTITGAQARVRKLERQNQKLHDLLNQYAHDRTLLAMLASEKAEFDNPLVIVQAEQIRDRILRRMGR